MLGLEGAASISRVIPLAPAHLSERLNFMNELKGNCSVVDFRF